jgi:crotonobetaine/carnitine-CoA ligase
MSRSTKPQTLGQLLQEKAERWPALAVLIFANLDGPDEVVTYGMLYTNGQKLAVALQKQGMRHGATFGVMMHNHPAFVYALVAASMLGAVLVPLDPRAQGEPLRYQLAHAGCQCLLVADYALPQVEEVFPQLPELRAVHVLQTGEEGVPNVASAYPVLNACLAGPEVSVVRMVCEPEQALEILYTSGTTGRPKGVIIDNRRLLGFAALGAVFGYRPDDRLYTGLSLAHGNAQAVTLMCALARGIAAVLTRKFTKSRLWDITRAYGITVFSLLGGMATALYSEPVHANDGDNPVRLVTSAGMPASLWEAFERRFNLHVLEWYGAVEGGFVYKPVGDGPVGSFGRLSPGQELRVVDGRNDDCPPGVVGELIFRPVGGMASLTYWQEPQAAREKVRHGWLRSGDMVHRNAQGYLFFDYRQGEAIRRNGEFIAPDAVARVLAEHPDVTDVYVYGIPAQSGAPGEQDMVAAVVPANPTRFNAASVFAACRGALAPNAIPSYLQVVAELPKTLSEKPQPRILREQFKATGANVFTPSALPL